MTKERTSIAVLGAFIIGIALRLWFVFTTFGTNDATFMRIWAELAQRYGIAEAYSHHPLLNHPPLALSIFRGLAGLGDVADLLRLMQIAADAISFACLLRLGNPSPGLRPPSPRDAGRGIWGAIVFFLSPAAVFLSGFHCNTDSTMVCLILVAVLLMRRAPFAGGIALALATGIKIVPLLLLPLFLVAAKRRWWQCLAGFAVAFAAIFTVVVDHPAALRNIFGYAGQAWWWGWPALAARMESALPFAGRIGVLHVLYGRFVIAAVVMAVAAVCWRKRSSLAAAIALTFVAVLFVSTGLAVQYFLWPLPFLPFLFRRWETIALHGVISIFMAAMYTAWSRGWPWTYANSLDLPWPRFDELVAAGLVAWAILGAAMTVGFVRLITSPAQPQGSE